MNAIRHKQILAKLDAILSALAALSSRLDAIQQITTKEWNQTMQDLTNLTQAVTQDQSVEESAITLIQGLAAQIQAAGTDPTALQSLVTQLNTNSAALAAAVAANTPAAVTSPV